MSDGSLSDGGHSAGGKASGGSGAGGLPENEFRAKMHEYSQLTRVALRGLCKQAKVNMSGAKGLLLGRLRQVIDPRGVHKGIHLAGVLDPSEAKPRPKRQRNRPPARLLNMKPEDVGGLKPKAGPGAEPCKLEERGKVELSLCGESLDTETADTVEVEEADIPAKFDVRDQEGTTIRHLDNFSFYDQNGKPASLEVLDNGSTKLQCFATVVVPQGEPLTSEPHVLTPSKHPLPTVDMLQQEALLLSERTVLSQVCGAWLCRQQGVCSCSC